MIPDRSICPATGGPHEYERDSDDFRSWVACIECGASPPSSYPKTLSR